MFRLVQSAVGEMITQGSTQFENPSSNADLAANIPPAMKKRLQFLGTMWGLTFSLWILFMIMYFSRTIVEDPWHTVAILAAVAWVFVVGPAFVFLLRRDVLIVEVRYRQRYGKWRWDR